MGLGKDGVPARTVNFLTSDRNQMLGTVITRSFMGEYSNILFHKCVLYNKSNGNCKVVPDNINV